MSRVKRIGYIKPLRRRLVFSVRVKARIEFQGRSVLCKALLNTSFEADAPEILIPVDIARSLNILPNLPSNTVVETYKTVSGLVRVYRVPGTKYTW